MKTKKIKCPITGKPSIEKAPPAKVLRKPAGKKKKARTCDCCGGDISHRRPQARTCGTPCRVWLVRHG